MTATAKPADERQRICPDCGSAETRRVQRGYTGPTDERDQYFVCRACDRITYEIVSRTPKEVRIGRLEPGRPMRIDGRTYEVVRVLKVGVSEALVYVRPSASGAAATPPRPGRR